MSAVHNPEWRLRGGFTPPVAVDNPNDPVYQGQFVIPRNPALGLDLSTWHKPKLKLGDYIDWANAAPPAAVSRPHAGFSWPMFLNDQLGDCVIAMMLHSIQDFHLDAQTNLPTLTDADASSWYGIIGGYVPGDPNTDNGCDESVAMQKWQAGLKAQDGTVHSIADTISVDPSNLVECRIAIYEFVDLQLGVALPQTAQGQTEWTVVGNPNSDPASQPGSWGGHGIPAREYDAETFKVVTWGGELLETVQFHQAYMQEAHVVVDKEQLNNSGVSVTGLQWGDLVSDLNKQFQQKAEAPKPKPKASTKSEPSGSSEEE